MKMKVNFNLLFGTLLLAAGTYLSGCTDKGTTPGVPQVSKGEPIQFSVGTAAGAESRTEYVDSFLLDWNVGDQIRIRCAQADPISADYQIAAVTSDQWGSLSPVDDSQVLKWGEINDTYKFYAAYPAGRVMNETDGAFSMEYMTNQLDTVVSLSNGAYLTNPDMNNAYMMAMKTVKMDTAKHHVRLDFNPIMTTFDITVRAGRYEVATGIINPVTVTGVSVIMPHKIKTDRFTYDANGGTTADEGKIKEDDIDKGVSQSVYVGVRNGTSRYVDLHEGETLNLMAFLPPVDMNADEDNNKVRIMVHTTGMDYVMSVDGDQITKQNKYFIQLPDMSPDDTTEDYNDWISELNPNTKINQLSIPAYVCTGRETAEEVESLLKMGIRAINIHHFFEFSSTVSGNKISSLEADLKQVLHKFLTDSKDFLIIWYYDDHTTGFRSRADDYFNDNFSNSWNGTIDIDKSISNLCNDNKRLIILKQNTNFNEDNDPHYFIQEEDYPAFLAGGHRTDLFPYSEGESNGGFISGKWGVRIIEDKNDRGNYSDDEKIDNYISLNNNRCKKVYEDIASYGGQTGTTGIVTIPFVGKIYVKKSDGTQYYTYSDLLFQSIIDCNFKFRH